MSSLQDRDYYKHLFTPESDDSIGDFNDNFGDSQPCHKTSFSYDIFQDFLAQGEAILKEDSAKFWNNNFEETQDHVDLSNQYWFEHDLANEFLLDDMDSTSSHSSASFSDSEDSDSYSSTSNSSQMSDPPQIINLLPEEDILRLLGQQPYSPPTNDPAPNPPPPAADKIGCYNIQNKFDHNTAAELFIKEEMTFLSLQEPHGMFHTPNDSWSSFQQLELQNARIASFITKHQIILYDTWKWGGKVMDDFRSFDNGRVTSIAFDLGHDQHIGIISVYASTVEALQGVQCQKDGKDHIISSAEIISEIQTGWKHKFGNICSIIMGDIQETQTQDDRDNLGNCRYATPELGILNLLENTHCSLVREMNPKIQYVTRIGRGGGRGIDHILTPVHPKFNNWFSEAKIERFLGQSYFPSDHSLLTCKFHRVGPNNREDGIEKRNYDFNKIFRIKVRKSANEDGGPALCFDDNQFKDCKKYNEQRDLYSKIQKITENNSDTTDYLLGDIEKRSKALFKNLWYAGLCQNVDGPGNKLVEINEAQAVEVAHIVSRFDAAIKDVMQSLSLLSDSNQNDRAGNVRGRLRKRRGFRSFSNLPIPTKLRYFSHRLKRKGKLIKHAINWLKENELRYQNNSEDPLWSEFIKIIIHLNDTSSMEKESVNLMENALREAEEREKHVESITHMKQNTNPGSTLPNKSLPNILPKVPDFFVDKINSWLREANCSQLFGISFSQENFNTLPDSISLWKKLTSTIDIETEDMNNEQFKSSSLTILEEALIIAKRATYKIRKLQCFYRKSTLQYFLNSNKISDFTQKMLPKNRAAPTTHTKIWDQSLDDFRLCQNEDEELRATSEFHGHWMNDSRAPETCAFAKTITKGKLGFRGVDLFPDRIVTEKDIGSLIHNGNKLPQRLKTAFVKAHGTHVSKLFRPPDQDCKDLFYPFYLTNKDGTINEESTVQEKFWKALVSIPSKARYDGFQLAVLGRFGQRWQKQLLNIVKLLLIMRYVPSSLKKIARFPIPKPGKKNEYRPISLCNDLYCFLNGIITQYSSAGIERAKILHEGIVAYRRGMGCHSLVTIEQCFREDCISGPWPAVQIDEDEEKFFDRVPVAILLAAMRVNGFPLQGYLEFKASAMGAKEVEIITCKGVSHARFICGLEQGNPDSPTVANLVIKFKHDVWNTITEEIKTVFTNENTSTNGKYSFHSVDPLDGRVIICKIGYCDDNSKFVQVRNENDLVRLVQYYIQLAGDLSMVTKIGRKGSKCDLQFFNVSAEFTIKLRKTLSVAWSFLQDSPVEEEVPFRVFMKKDELARLKDLIMYDSLDDIEKDKWNNIIDSDAHRHLGMIGTMAGSTKETSLHFLNNMRNRLKTLKISNLDAESQQKCINMLINTMHSYIPLQANHSAQDLLDFDNLIAQTIQKSNGITASDTKHRIFLPKSLGGLGISSALEIDTISVARELEIVSNGCSLDSYAFRTRIADTKKIYVEEELNFVYFNHAKEAISKLARYGIFIRDRRDGIVNDVLDLAGSSNKFVAVGHRNYANGNGHSIGIGKESTAKLGFGGETHKALLALRDNKWIISEEIAGLDKLSAIKYKDAVRSLIKIKATRIKEAARLYDCWEWTNTMHSKSSYKIPTPSDNWEHISIINDNFQEMYKSIDWDRADESIFDNVKEKLLLVSAKDFSWHAVSESIRVRYEHKYASILNFLLSSKSPIILATDGALKSSSTQNCTRIGSGLSLCMLDIRNSESLQSMEWIERPVIPLLTRCSLLPNVIGNDVADISSAECHAFLLSELTLPRFLPRIIITDSEAVRDQVLAARNLPNFEINRKIVRSTIGGIGKCIMGTMATIINKSNIANATVNACLQNPLLKSVIAQLTTRNETFINIAKAWTLNSKDSQPEHHNWRKDYFDADPIRCILKINSHQLDNSGTKIKANKRYQSLSPNLCLLSANHLADRVADIPFSEGFHDIKLEQHKILNPSSPLRFYFSINGASVDKHVNKSLQDMFTREKVKRLKTKKTQGLLWRLMDHVTPSWNELALHSGFLRSLIGLSRTHTRSLYKAGDYRQGMLQDFLETITSQEDKLKIGKLNQKGIIQLLCPCKWCPENSPHRTQHGNRMHALLHCDHKDISGFRNNMRNIIEDELRKFMKFIQIYTSEEQAIRFIHHIQNTFLRLQSEQVGRLRKISIAQNLSYASINDLLDKYGQSNVLNCIHSGKTQICLEIFGILPQCTTSLTSDANIGAADSPWLGLTPVAINSQILIQRKCIATNVAHLKNKNVIIQQFDDKWDLIKGLTLGLAAGIHKIIGGTSRTFEKNLKRKHNLDPYSLSALRKKAKGIRNQINQPNHPPTKTQCIPCNPHINQANIIQIDKRVCTGITCNKRKNSWKIFKHFIPNQIPTTKKHCLRCTRQSSALRSADMLLRNLQTNGNIDAIKQMLSTFEQASLTCPRYSKLMNLLQPHFSTEFQRDRAQYTNKSRILDTHKSICRVIIQAFTTNSNDIQEPKRKLNIIQQFLETTLANSEERLLKLKKHIKEEKSNQLNSTPITPTHQDELLTPSSVNNSSENIPRQQNHYIREATEPDAFMSSMGIRWAIEVLRHMKYQQMYFANPDISTLISDWSTTQGWTRIARAFGCRRVACNKPDGYYFLPLFEGSTTSGHWFTVVVHKIGRFRVGYVIDSLGNSCTTSTLLQKIRDMFGGSDATFSWNSVLTKAQVEVECGPRSVQAIATIARNIHGGNDLQSSINSATLLTNENEPYDPNEIRRSTAHLLRQYRTNMWTNPVRVRTERDSDPQQNGDQPRKKRRRKKSKKA